MGISPEVGVAALWNELVDRVSMLEVELELVLKGTTESRDPSRLRAFGAGGAR